MPLSVREVLLVLRAKDQASRVIADVGRSFLSAQDEAAAAARQQIHAGQALLGVGVAMAATGAAGLAFYGSMANAAIDYNKQATLTLTQTDLGIDKLNEIKEIGRQVGSQVGVPFKELQTALYDIFSSTNATVPQAQLLLTAFAKTAVAGQVSIQDAGRATMAILNAFHIPIEDVNHVLDVQFELVRKGVGTYEEFATTIGRAIPSAVRAGQTIETLSGMLAFSTRNGLSAAMAATSVARALDAMSNPKVVGRLEAMGIKVKDAKGEYREMGAIIADLSKKMEKMTNPERASFLQNLFKGAGGTIQARRFLDIALKHPEDLQGFIADMQNSAGAAGDAYAKMADTVAVKTQLLKNEWDILKTYIGDIVIPIFRKLVEWGTKFLRWLIDMDPHTKKLIVYISLIASALLILMGVLLGVAGVMLVFLGTLALLEIPLAPFLALLLLVVGALLVLGIMFYRAWENSEQFRQSIKDLWGDLKRIWDVFKEQGWKAALDFAFDGIRKRFSEGWTVIAADLDVGWSQIWQDFQTGWDTIMANFNAGLPHLGESFVKGLEVIGGAVRSFFVDTLWPDVANWILSVDWSDLGSKVAVGFLKGLWWLIEHFVIIIAGIGNWIGNHAEDIVQLGLQLAGHLVEGFWKGIKDIPVLGQLLGGVESGLKGILSIGVGNPYQQATVLSPGEQAISNQFAAQSSINDILSAVTGMFGAGGQTTQTVFDIHDNAFEVANMDDLINQMGATNQLNNKAAGAALPAPPPVPKAKTTNKNLAPLKGPR